MRFPESNPTTLCHTILVVRTGGHMDLDERIETGA